MVSVLLRLVVKSYSYSLVVGQNLTPIRKNIIEREFEKKTQKIKFALGKIDWWQLISRN